MRTLNRRALHRHRRPRSTASGTASRSSRRPESSRRRSRAPSASPASFDDFEVAALVLARRHEEGASPPLPLPEGSRLRAAVRHPRHRRPGLRDVRKVSPHPHDVSGEGRSRLTPTGSPGGLRPARRFSEILRHRPTLGRRPRTSSAPPSERSSSFRPASRRSSTPPRRVSSDARPTRAECAVTGSTPAARADAWNRSPTICGESGTTRSPGPGLDASRSVRTGAGDVALHEPHVPRLALRVRLAAPDRHQHPVAGGRLGRHRPTGGRSPRLSVYHWLEWALGWPNPAAPLARRRWAGGGRTVAPRWPSRGRGAVWSPPSSRVLDGYVSVEARMTSTGAQGR